MAGVTANSKSEHIGQQDCIHHKNNMENHHRYLEVIWRAYDFVVYICDRVHVFSAATRRVWMCAACRPQDRRSFGQQ